MFFFFRIWLKTKETKEGETRATNPNCPTSSREGSSTWADYDNPLYLMIRRRQTLGVDFLEGWDHKVEWSMMRMRQFHPKSQLLKFLPCKPVFRRVHIHIFTHIHWRARGSACMRRRSIFLNFLFNFWTSSVLYFFNSTNYVIFYFQHERDCVKYVNYARKIQHFYQLEDVWFQNVLKNYGLAGLYASGYTNIIGGM